ncbi:MAG: hypothetical protein KatS3mg028_1409 [Bacteroidia bacterium]|nr:MAG: hypothetical protein KatS3mg028_1409 [Bacteroidia bacterium]
MIDTIEHKPNSPAGNSTFAIGGVLCSAESFVVAESSILRMNICAEKPAHRKSANRWAQYKNDRRPNHRQDTFCLIRR